MYLVVKMTLYEVYRSAFTLSHSYTSRVGSISLQLTYRVQQSQLLTNETKGRRLGIFLSKVRECEIPLVSTRHQYIPEVLIA